MKKYILLIFFISSVTFCNPGKEDPKKKGWGKKDEAQTISDSSLGKNQSSPPVLHPFPEGNCRAESTVSDFREDFDVFLPFFNLKKNIFQKGYGKKNKPALISSVPLSELENLDLQQGLGKKKELFLSSSELVCNLEKDNPQKNDEGKKDQFLTALGSCRDGNCRAESTSGSSFNISGPFFTTEKEYPQGRWGKKDTVQSAWASFVKDFIPSQSSRIPEKKSFEDALQFCDEIKKDPESYVHREALEKLCKISRQAIALFDEIKNDKENQLIAIDRVKIYDKIKMTDDNITTALSMIEEKIHDKEKHFEEVKARQKKDLARVRQIYNFSKEKKFEWEDDFLKNLSFLLPEFQEELSLHKEVIPLLDVHKFVDKIKEKIKKVYNKNIKEYIKLLDELNAYIESFYKLREESKMVIQRRTLAKKISSDWGNQNLKEMESLFFTNYLNFVLKTEKIEEIEKKMDLLSKIEKKFSSVYKNNN